MKHTSFENTQGFARKPVLVIDRQGVIGYPLSSLLAKDFPVVLVSSKRLKESMGNVVEIPFLRRAPLIPGYAYSEIFVVYQGEKEVKEILPQLVKKVEEDRSRLILLVHMSLCKQSFTEKIAAASNRVTLVVYGDIFGENFFDQEYVVSRFLKQALVEERIDIPGHGTDHTFPISIQEVVLGLVKIVDGAVSVSRVFFLFPKHPLTLLRLAYMVQKADPLVKLDFVAKRKSMDYSAPFVGEYLVDSSYSVEKEIKRICKENPFPLKSGLQDDRDSQRLLSFSKQKESPSLARFLRFFALFFVFLALLPLITTASLIFVGARNTYQAGKLAESGYLNEALVYAKSSEKYFSNAQKIGKILAQEAFLINKKEDVVSAMAHLSQVQSVSLAFSSLLEALVKYRLILNKDVSSPGEDVASVINGIKDAYVVFQRARVELDLESDRLAYLSFFWGSFVSRWTQADRVVSRFGSVFDIAPLILGFEGEKKYLVLFQNNMELRPAGGFIGSYATLSLENGEVKKPIVHNVYDADGQLKGHIEPPFPIRRFLPSVHWFLRDSNFDVDFVKAASSSANLFLAETEEMVDGVIAIDTTFVKNILRHIGPVYLPEYKKFVTQDNAYEIIQEYVEKNSFSGSAQKQEFLTSLLTAIEQKIFSKDALPYLDILETVDEAISQKHLLFAFSDRSLQQPFTISGMSSSLLDLRETEENRVLDFLGISEANLGVNKVNYFIKRKIDYATTINESREMESTVSVSYKNLSDKSHGGDYKNYLRIIVPFGVRLKQIFIDGKQQKIVPAVTNPKLYEAKKFAPPSGLEVEEEKIGTNTIFGFLLIVPAGEYKTVDVSYERGRVISSASSLFTYDLWYFKQPGTQSYPLSLRLSYPKEFVPVKLPKEFIRQSDNITYSTIASTDERIVLNFVNQ